MTSADVNLNPAMSPNNSQPENATQGTAAHDGNSDNERDNATASAATAAAAETIISPTTGRPRTMTSTAEIGSTISHPGSVKINVEGAFIVESPESGTPAGSIGISGSGSGNAGGYYETKDIRLPNHTAVVSHIAVDVSFCRRAFHAT